MSQSNPSAQPFQPHTASANQPEASPDQKMVRLEEYKLFVEDTARFSDRRQTITNTYISVNSALAGLLVFLVKDSGLTGWLLPSAVIILIGFGLVICSYWARLIHKYKTLVGFRIKILREMEKDIPGSIKMYHREDELYPVDKDNNPIPGQGLNISDLEVSLPVVFRWLYLALAAFLVAGFLWKSYIAPSASNAQPVPSAIVTPGAASPSP